ncbi:hypothetical protein BD779DRAFT_1142307 [Infundibulicybe gibba]|nr:hypothetical protein BD779DRAFT_1142307 [Infundibulicybe gibba]
MIHTSALPMLFGALQALLTLTVVLATPAQDAFNPGRYKITNVHFRGDARVLNISETVIAGPYGDSPLVKICGTFVAFLEVSRLKTLASRNLPHPLLMSRSGVPTDTSISQLHHRAQQ